MRVGILICVVLFAGCAVDMIQVRKRLFGPVKEVGIIDPGGGHLRYALNGPGWLVRGRRKKAFRQMAEYCEGEALFRVTKEISQEDILTPFNAVDLEESALLDKSHYRVQEYRHLEFDCVVPGK